MILATYNSSGTKLFVIVQYIMSTIGNIILPPICQKKFKKKCYTISTKNRVFIKIF